MIKRIQHPLQSSSERTPPPPQDVFDDDGRVGAERKRGLPLLETLRRYRTARDKLRELVPELVTDLADKK